MQRKLFIIRHGKSSWETVVADIDRPLNERGVKNAYEMASYMLDRGLVPELVISSPANRALHTAIIMANVWGMKDQNIWIRRSLYLPEVEDITETLYEVDDAVSSVAVFGHNPGFTHFANQLARQTIDNVPTAGVVCVEMEMDAWNDIFNAKIGEVIFDCPKKHR